MRRRRSSRDGKKDPVRTLGMAMSRSPACVVSTFSRCPLRIVVRVSVCSPGAAPMWAVASASISSCRIRWARTLINSIPSAVRSDSISRSKSCWDKAIAPPLNERHYSESRAMAAS